MLPQTTGKLKFKIKDMEVGDFIPCNYVSSSFSTAGQILYLGHDLVMRFLLIVKLILFLESFIL